MILVIDHNPGTARQSALLLSELGYESAIETNPQKLKRIFSDLGGKLEMVLLDVRLPDIDGFELISRIRNDVPGIGVIVATIMNDVDTAVRAIQAGAHGYLLKPLRKDTLAQAILGARSRLPVRTSFVRHFPSVIGVDPGFQQTLWRIGSLALTVTPILILGEPGTGKSLLARSVPQLRGSPQRPALTISPGEPAVFTDNITQIRGAVAANPSGLNIILEDLHSLSLRQQNEVLALLRECAQVTPEERPDEARARVVATASSKLPSSVHSGNFSSELYHLLAPYGVYLPPLRERAADISALAAHFLSKSSRRTGKSIETISTEASEALQAYTFPGNVGELENIINSAVLLSSGPVLERNALPPHVRGISGETELSLEAVRYRTIMKALAECGGNQTEAAKKLGIARGSLNRMLQSYKKRTA